MASYQTRRAVLTGQWTDATGNQKGTALSPAGDPWIAMVGPCSSKGG